MEAVKTFFFSSKKKKGGRGVRMQVINFNLQEKFVLFKSEDYPYNKILFSPKKG